MNYQAMAIKYGVMAGIAFGAIWASNNIDVVKKVVGKTAK